MKQVFFSFESFLSLSETSRKNIGLLIFRGWHKHLMRILDGAYQMAVTIEAGDSVLCHCSDGWDRTSQLTAISMIMLDPYYRTFEGFLVCLNQFLWHASYRQPFDY
jgi:hypothetical protein